MNVTATDRRIEFAPPPQPGMLRAYALAVLAHLLLIAALTWGVHWKRDAENVAVEAELWSSVPQQAAPRAVESPPPQPVPPPPAPVPIPQPAPTPAPPPPVRVAPSVRDADIAIERQKKELEKEKLEQQQKLEQDKREQKKKLDAEKRAEEKQAALDKQKQDQQQEAQKKAAEKAQAKAQAEVKAQAQAQAKAEAKAEAKAQALAKAQADKLHQQTVKNMLAMANAEGGANATGNALRSSGPSGSYGARVAAAVRPNVVFPDADLVSGNPAAEFNVQLAPDGTIVGTPKLIKSSGVPAWDEAALRALEKTEKLPRDTDGRVPPALIVDLKPKR